MCHPLPPARLQRAPAREQCSVHYRPSNRLCLNPRCPPRFTPGRRQRVFHLRAARESPEWKKTRVKVPGSPAQLLFPRTVISQLQVRKVSGGFRGLGAAGKGAVVPWEVFPARHCHWGGFQLAVPAAGSPRPGDTRGEEQAVPPERGREWGSGSHIQPPKTLI